MTTPEPSPYVGPRPFEVQDQKRFFGRDREASELLSMVVAHPVLLFYAQSGAGKTSLINARLIPMLREAEMEVFPVTRLRATLPTGTDLNELDNPFAFSAILGWAAPETGATEGSAPLARLMTMTLRDYLASRPHQTDNFDEPMPRVLIFDQFEELFTAYPEHWQKREPFIQQIADALAADPLLRVILSIREDFVAQLDPFAARLPERMQARFRMERLGGEAAQTAIEGPLIYTDREYAEGVPEILVYELLRNRVQSAEGKTVEVTGQYVEPVQLQVVCNSIWANLPADTRIITEEHLRRFGNVDQALNDFYDRVLRDAVTRTGVPESALRRWCEEVLITGLGTRNTVYRGPEDTGGMENEVIDILEDRHLIRAERRAGARWYELTHDRLIEPIRASNREWFEARAQVRARRLLSALLVVGALFVVGAVIALLLRTNSVAEFAAAATAQAAESQARLSREWSALLASSAGQAWEANDPDLALALAVEANTVASQTYTVQRGETLFRIAQRFGVAVEEIVAANNIVNPSLIYLDQALVIPTVATEAQRVLADIASAPGARRRVELGDAVLSVAYHPDGQMALAGLANGDIVLWDTETGAEVRRLSGHSASVESVAFSPDGQQALSGSRDMTLILWDLETGAPVHQFEVGSRVTSVAFSPDGARALSGSDDRTVRLWNLVAGVEAGRFEGHRAKVQSVAFGPPPNPQAASARYVEYQYALSGSLDNTLILWDAATGAMLRRLEGHTDYVNSVAISPDGFTALSGSDDQTVRLWDLTTGESRALTGHTSRVLSVAYSPDGLTALSASADGTVILWDAKSGAQIYRFYGHTGVVRSVAYSPGGQRALSGAEDGSVRVWDLQPADLADLSSAALVEWTYENRYVRALTCAERERYRVEPLCTPEGVAPTRTPTAYSTE
ncbi:MAG: hypothetical protein Kow00120_09930 [Anaerolineae bacterium]